MVSINKLVTGSFGIGGSTGHAETIFTFTGNRTASLNISGTLEYSWTADDEVRANIFNYGGSEILRQSELVSVDIGNTVTSIGDYALSGCSGLTNVTIPDSVESIGTEAFSNCDKLTDVTIPYSVERIGEDAFVNCS